MLGVVVACALSLGAGAAPAGAQTSSTPPPAPVRFADTSLRGVEGRGPVQVVVERTDLPVSRLLVHFRTDDDEGRSAVAGSDYLHTAGTLVFEVGVRSASFFVTVRDDEVVEATEYLLLQLSTSSDGVATSRLTVLDDDLAESTAVAAATAPAPPPTTAPPRASAATPPPTTTPPVVVAASAAVRRPVVVTRSRVVAPRPAPPRRIILQQAPTTPFELRPLPGSAGSSGVATAVDPLLALGAGVLLARVAAEIWFRARIAAG